MPEIFLDGMDIDPENGNDPLVGVICCAVAAFIVIGLLTWVLGEYGFIVGLGGAVWALISILAKRGSNLP